MVLEEKKHLTKIAIVALTTFVSIKLWSFSKIDEGKINLLEILILFSLAAIVIYNHNKISRQNLIFKYNAHLFIWIPFLSAFGALLFHDQPFNLSLLILRTNFYWLLYFVLHIFEIPVKSIIKLMIFTGCVWIFLTVVQQFTYPRYYFFTRDDEDQSIFRAGVYRFMVMGQHYGLFVLFYFFYKYITQKNAYSLLFVAAGLSGFYFFGTRQFALSALVCMCISIFFLKGKPRFIFLMLLSCCLLILLQFKDQLFGQYVEMTSEQLEYGDDIRLLSANFFLIEYWPNWLAKITGNGQAYASSAYGREMLGINEYFHFYRSDVGIIGAYNQFGILYALNILWVNIKGLRNKFYSYDTKYLQLFFFNAVFLLILSEYYSNGSGIPFYCFIMYLVDRSFEEKQLIGENVDS